MAESSSGSTYDPSRSAMARDAIAIAIAAQRPAIQLRDMRHSGDVAEGLALGRLGDNIEDGRFPEGLFDARHRSIELRVERTKPAAVRLDPQRTLPDALDRLDRIDDLE